MENLPSELDVVTKKLNEKEEQRANAVKAFKKTINDKVNVEEEYRKISEQLGVATRQNSEILEKFKVTEDILQAIEKDHEEREELDKRRKSDQQNYEITIDDDEENLVEDIDTGILNPTKITKIVKIGLTQESVCKKCDKTITEKEVL